MTFEFPIVKRDKFEAEDIGHLAIPCCWCTHQHKTDKEEPCRTCDHNALAAPDQQTEGGEA